MLRDYMKPPLVMRTLLQQFGVEAEGAYVDFYKALTPDSFIWRIRRAKETFYLYAEDFIENLDSVRKAIESVAGAGSGEFIPVRVNDAVRFEEASPVLHATVYKKPDDFDETIRNYATDSGYDFVFLYKLRIPDSRQTRGTVGA